MTEIGRSSMAIDVELHGEDVLSGERTKSTAGRFVFVALGADGRPAPIDAPLPCGPALPETWTTERVQPGQANYSGHLLGGELMRLLDTVAFIAATRHARQALVTAAVSELHIRADVRIGDLIYIGGEVTNTGGWSLTVRTEHTVDADCSMASRPTCGEIVLVRI